MIMDLDHISKTTARQNDQPYHKSTLSIIKFLDQYKNLMSATLKHACEINDVVLNWKKIKKFINSNKTGNETNGRDRGYTA